jgi:hypothetical protein
MSALPRPVHAPYENWTPSSAIFTRVEMRQAKPRLAHKRGTSGTHLVNSSFNSDSCDASDGHWKAFGERPRQFGSIVPGVFTPVLAKHTKSFNLIDTLTVGVDRIQRSFEPMRRQVEEWRQAQITDERAKLILYAAFVDGKLEAQRTLLPEVHRLYFQPE